MRPEGPDVHLYRRMAAALTARIRRLTGADDRTLAEMYRQFEPLGVAAGLPPRNEQARREWIKRSLEHEINFGAFSPNGELAGHCFLAADGPGSAEMAVFVHQNFRNQGVGRQLIRAAIQEACRKHIQRVWTMTSADNLAALALLKRCGFRTTQRSVTAFDLELELEPACAAAAPHGATD